MQRLSHLLIGDFSRGRPVCDVTEVTRLQMGAKEKENTKVTSVLKVPILHHDPLLQQPIPVLGNKWETQKTNTTLFDLNKQKTKKQQHYSLMTVN